MSYYTTDEVKARLRIGLSKDDGNQPRLGCDEPTFGYGETPGVGTFEEGVANGDIIDIPEVEFPERLEALERGRSTLFDRIDADYTRALTQGRCGYCWAYAVIGAIMTAYARDGLPFEHLAAAYIAAKIKGGADRGGWPVEAAQLIASGEPVPTIDQWADCSCSGGGCRGPRSGCQARDLSRAESVARNSQPIDLKFYELPRDTEAPTIRAILQGLPVAAGWVGTRSWCDGHAMQVPHVMRDRRKGWRCVPENSWGMFKRRIPSENFPRGGVVVVRAKREAA